jgi:hypothetical protein
MPRPPGTWLLGLARLLFDESVRSRVVHPTIADLQQEVHAAGASRRRRLLARWRGYRAFWALVVVAPVAFRNWPVAPHTDRRALLHVSGLIVLALVASALLMTTMPITGLIDLLPDGWLRALGDARLAAVMAGPAVLILLVALRWTLGSERFVVRTTEATLFSLLSVTAAIVAGTAAYATVFTGIARTGSGGLGVIVEAAVSSLQSLALASLTLAACLIVIALLSARLARASHPPSATPPARMPARLAVALSALLWVAIVAADLLLRTYRGTMALASSMFAFPPGSPAGASSLAEAVTLLEHNMSLLFLGGSLLTVFLIAAGVTTLRVSRACVPHPILTWTSRVALIVAVAGAVYHATTLRAGMEAYHDILTRPAVAMAVP